MELCLAEPVARVLESHEEDTFVCALFRLEFSGVSRFLFYIGDGTGESMELFDGSEGEAKDLYRSIRDGRLSVWHLSDVIRDARHGSKIF